MPDFESRDFSSAWRSLQSQKCHNCGKRVPADAEFGKNKHAVLVDKKGMQIWCDACYDKEVDVIKKPTSTITVTKKEMHELSDSEREKLK